MLKNRPIVGRYCWVVSFFFFVVWTICQVCICDVWLTCVYIILHMHILCTNTHSECLWEKKGSRASVCRKFSPELTGHSTDSTAQEKKVKKIKYITHMHLKMISAVLGLHLLQWPTKKLARVTSCVCMWPRTCGKKRPWARQQIYLFIAILCLLFSTVYHFCTDWI